MRARNENRHGLPLDVMTRLKSAAEIQGRTLTDFVVAAADESACRTIQESEIIRLRSVATANCSGWNAPRLFSLREAFCGREAALDRYFQAQVPPADHELSCRR